MDETIDLRPYVDAIIKRWWVIIGFILAFVLLAVFFYLSQTQYRATALIAITDPTQRLQFDNRIVNTVDLDNLLDAYPEIASSDAVLTALLTEARELSNGSISTLPDLQDITDAETGADGRLVRLIVRHEDPEFAANIANSWASIFVSTVDSIYLPSMGEVEFFDNQLAQTKNALQTVEQELEDFQASSRLGIVENELAALQNRQSIYLAEQNRHLLILDDIRSLRGQIAAGSSDTIPWGDQLTSLILQLKLFETENIFDTVPSGTPLQLQLSSQSNLTTEQRNEQLALLDNLSATAETSISEIDVKKLGLESEIFDLQRERQIITNRYEQLLRDQEIAKETYLTLARKIDEVRIQSSDNSNSLRVASLATPPTEPNRSNLIVTATIAGLAGLLISMGILLVLTWWKTSNERAN